MLPVIMWLHSNNSELAIKRHKCCTKLLPLPMLKQHNDSLFLQPPKTKFRNINLELLASFKEVEGLPPQKSSCVKNGYWVRAAAYCSKVKWPTQRLAKAVRNYWLQHAISRKIIVKKKQLKIYLLPQVKMREKRYLK